MNGEEKLKEDAGDYDDVMDAYWGYYADWLHSIEHELKYGDTRKYNDAVILELDNISLGWYWAVEGRRFEKFQEALNSFVLSLDFRTLNQNLFDLSNTALEGSESTPNYYQKYRVLWWHIKGTRIKDKNTRSINIF